jgi:stearoyl-CoA desaturase (delta-9 desaturase)
MHDSLFERRDTGRLAPKGSVILDPSGEPQRGRIGHLSRDGLFMLVRLTAPERWLDRSIDVELRLDDTQAEWLRAIGRVERVAADGLAIRFDAPVPQLLRETIAELTAAAARARGSAMSMILIDGDASRGAALAAGLRAYGCTVVQVTSTLEAIVRLGEASFEPDVVAIAALQPGVEELRAFIAHDHPNTRLVTFGDELLEPDGIAHWLAVDAEPDPLPRMSTGQSLAVNAPYWIVHTAALVGAILVGWSWQAGAWLGGSYLVRTFAISATYHRYFAHRTFKTSRAFQLVLAVLGMTCAQQGPLWWAAHHRRHHKHADDPQDLHSPRQGGFVWAHVRWILSARYQKTDLDRIRDFARFPELRWLNSHDALFVIGSAVLLLLVGGPTALVWGFFVSLVASWHATFTVNSLTHMWGRRRYATDDDSRNNALIAVLTLGEGWHNNHHHYPRSARLGFRWWQIDLTYYVLRVFSWLGLVWNLEVVPRHVRDAAPSPARTRLRATSASA